MSRVFPGRYTAEYDGEVTVFLIGMRFNKLWKIGSWLPVLAAMPRMLVYLSKHPETGLLGFHNWFGRTTMLVSYWESPEHLQRFAADRDAPHLEPWRRYMRKVGSRGDVGVYHETYRVRAEDRETVYANMPAMGLAAATAHVPVAAGANTAKQRLAAGH